jgi:hypothetical protein
MLPVSECNEVYVTLVNLILVCQTFVCAGTFAMTEDESYVYSVTIMWYIMNPCMLLYMILIAYGYQSRFRFYNYLQ